jgi:hypothetical protein
MTRSTIWWARSLQKSAFIFLYNEKKGTFGLNDTSYRLLAHDSGTSTPVPAHELQSKGFWNDIVTMKWMQRPCKSVLVVGYRRGGRLNSSNDLCAASSSKILGLPIILAINWSIAAPKYDNFWLKIFTITNRRPDSPEGFPLYAKSYWVSAQSQARMNASLDTMVLGHRG